jgi:hypothetical protein
MGFGLDTCKGRAVVAMDRTNTEDVEGSKGRREKINIVGEISGMRNKAVGRFSRTDYNVDGSPVQDTTKSFPPSSLSS